MTSIQNSRPLNLGTLSNHMFLSFSLTTGNSIRMGHYNTEYFVILTDAH